MRKYAGELRVGDVWTERPQGRAPHSYRVITIGPGLAPTTTSMMSAAGALSVGRSSADRWQAPGQPASEPAPWSVH
jgi:hypothetical protein